MPSVFPGTYTVAVVFGGIVTSRSIPPPRLTHLLAIRPYGLSCDALTESRPLSGYGRITIFLNPTASLSDRMPARYSYNQTFKSPICITWFPEFIAGSAVSPFHNSQIV